MASIIQISGTKNKISTPNTRWSITANEACLFEVPEWIPKTTPNPLGGILPVPPAQIEPATRAKVTWELKDKTQKILFKTIAGNVLDKFNFSINKKYSGSYTYSLEATLNGKSLKASTFVSGFCDPKIVTAKWSKKEATSDMTDLKCGNILYVNLDTEGLNGDKLTFELWHKKETKPIATVTEDCINGDCIAKIPTIGAAALTKTATESFFVKVKNAAGVYIKKGSDEKVIDFKILKDVVPPVADLPTNTTVLKVGELDKVTLESTGIISLEKIAVTTTYDVCNDEVGKFDDYKNFWILENDGKHYHWLKKSLIGKTEKEDVNKPSAIPITLASTDNFVFTATFETILPAEVKVRVRDKDDKYKFDVVAHPKKAKKELHPIKFTSTNKPYAKTVQYFENFELIFEYSVDGTSWTPMGSAMFCFYVTWKEPGYKKFEVIEQEIKPNIFIPDENSTMQIKCAKNSDKKNILETLLWLGCKQAKEKGNLGKSEEENEEQILDDIFKKFSTKNVIRSREGSYVTKNWSTEGMGYWRGISAAGINPISDKNDPKTYMFYEVATKTHIERTSRVILKHGEFRCGEWTNFLIYLGLTQGILLKQFAIYSGTGYDSTKNDKIKTNFVNKFFLVKGWTINDPLSPSLPPSTTYRAQGNASPLHNFSDHVFTIFERNSIKKFYDASYGIKFAKGHAKDKELLSEYSTTALDGVLYMKEAVAGKPEFKTITTKMEDHLVIKLYDLLERNPYLIDDKITYTL